MTRDSWEPWKERHGDEERGDSGRWPVPSRGTDEEAGSFWQAMAYLTSLGWILALPVAAGVLLGAWVDGQLGTAPTFTLALLATGIVVAAVEAYLVVAEAHGEEDEEEES